jgi:hypothetical protein
MAKRAFTFALLALAACENVEQDLFVSNGGTSPDPTAIFEGTVLYTGPRPRCRFVDGRFEQVLGRVALTLFEYNNPPPPEGSASSALNIAFVNGDELFSERDCLADGAPDTGERISRSVAFQWPRITLLARAASYQIRGFYDYDADMIPLYSVTRLPTAGDVVGAALKDVRDSSRGLLEITLPRMQDAEDGLVVGGITIALGDVVRSERPAFLLDANRTLSAAQPFVPALTPTFAPDPAASLRAFRASTCATPDTPDCGLSLVPLADDLAPTLLADGVQIDLADRVASAFYSEPVDIKTVVLKGDTSNGVDPAVPDGKVDPHPFLGAGLGVPWYTPAVIMQRLPIPGAAVLELQARIPRVLMVGSVLVDDTLTPVKRSYVESSVPVAMPPVAAVELIPGRAECRVPYFAPGTPGLVTDGRLGNCDELPTGRYAVNVLAGVAGGTSVAATSGESPTLFSGARYSGQSWSVPNELGDSTQASTPVAGQGFEDTFVVQDPSEGKATCATSSFNGLCANGVELIENAAGVDSTACLFRECCDFVTHLCGLPVCARVSTASGASIRASPTRSTGTHANGAVIPDCVPFELPWQCCRAAP